MPAYIKEYSFCSPLGIDPAKALLKILNGQHGFSERKIGGSNPKTEILGEFDSAILSQIKQGTKGEDGCTFFEQTCIFTIQRALHSSGINPASADCLFVLSSTKGNIGEINTGQDSQNTLFSSAKKIAAYFKNQNRPLVVSNACISGVLALIMAKDQLENRSFKHVIVIGCDVLSEFVINGFESFQALSTEPCRPFDKTRNGLNLGEAAACIILSSDTTNNNTIKIAGGGLSNDANHLSGPSRTGEELATAIRQALKEASLTAQAIQMISAHGTATRYNDEMEAKALELAGAQHAPLHSLKSYMGHTLGAAGIIETIFAAMAMKEAILLPSLNFSETDVPAAIQVCTQAQPAEIDYVLKTASGFGGCNAALVLSK